MIMKPNRCKSRTKDGQACRAAASSGGLCFFHANPLKAAELGRMGGRRNRGQATVESLPPLPRITNLAALRDATAQLVESIYQGVVDPRIGTGLAPLLSVQLKAIDVAELEERVARLEQERSTREGTAALKP
jgi:hypothetical protein